MGSPRFEGKPGSNPEELIGAAHAACFTMALSRILGDAELTAEQMETKAEVTLEKQGDGFAITSVHLTLVAKIPGADKAKFAELVGMAKGRPCRNYSIPRLRWRRRCFEVSAAEMRCRGLAARRLTYPRCCSGRHRRADHISRHAE